MNWFRSNRIYSVMVVALCSACASTRPVVDTNVTIDFPPSERVESVEQADRVLAAVTLSRAQIDWRYHQKEQICYTRFFMNDCLLDAKTERRLDLAKVKKIEVEANYFKRRNTVEEMDRSLVEHNVANPLPEPKAEEDTDAAGTVKNESDKAMPSEPVKPVETDSNVGH